MGLVMKEMTRVEQFERIRRDHRDEEMSIRELAKKYKVHRRTVRQAIDNAVPPPRKSPVRVAPVLGAHVETVRGWLIEDLQVKPKQRHTARRVWQRLMDEHGVQVAESTVRAVVARLREEVEGSVAKVPIVQEHPLGEEAEVDFGEFEAVIAGVVMTLWMFVMRLSYSGKAVHIAYANQAQESFLDGHVQAFERFGGVPAKMIRYDNLKPAVIRVALGRERLENPNFIAMRSHYMFDSFFCIPGKDGAHEKGGVENEVGRFRRNYLVPVPEFDSIAELNEFMAACDVKDDGRRIEGRPRTVGAMAAEELPVLRPLPVEGPFDAATALHVRVDAKARVCVRQAYYSVPARFAGRRAQVRLGARTVSVFVGGMKVAEHVRSIHKYTDTLELDHYLEVLATKPGALPGSRTLAQARTAGVFTDTHQRFWDQVRTAHGDQEGTRTLIEVLLLHRTLSAASVLAGIKAAGRIGVLSPEVVAVEARRHGEASSSVVVDIGRPLPADERALPSLAGYDGLLGVGV